MPTLPAARDQNMTTDFFNYKKEEEEEDAEITPPCISVLSVWGSESKGFYHVNVAE